VVVHELAELAQVGPELLGRDRGVLPAGPGLPAVGAPGQDAGPGFADTPQRPGLGRVGDDPAGAAGPGGVVIAAGSLYLIADLLAAGPRERASSL